MAIHNQIKPSSGNFFIIPNCIFKERLKARVLAVYCYKKNGIQGKTQHGLRHTFATRSNEYNMNAKALSSMMGHKKTDITYDIYVDSDLNNKRLETDKLYEKMSSDFDLSIDIEP